ncbi:hypothetical protein XELAEV_18008790mg [Xenopus laevis]|uniref:Uncharacterized protein n=1 Tax=Xenopus laevis TaxID=8355 RepID=A0A974DR55_XENLA|nr:hypothetical protein XELAEV_18008790mg [Xenopus laevis]
MIQELVISASSKLITLTDMCRLVLLIVRHECCRLLIVHQNEVLVVSVERRAKMTEILCCVLSTKQPDSIDHGMGKDGF